MFKRIKQFEYWPTWLFYAPVFWYIFYQAIRVRSLHFFLNINTGMENAGFFGAKKNDINNTIPKEYLPKQFLLKEGMSKSEIVSEIEKNSLNFPLVLKPNIGERGTGVTRVCTLEELIQHIEKYVKNEWILQEFIEFQLELAVFYSKTKNEKDGIISSVCQKEFMRIQGNGKDSIRQLMEKNQRFERQIKRLSKTMDLDRIPTLDEVVTLDVIGNHCRGTKFINRNDLITEEFSRQVNEISKQIEGFDFGRFDLKTTSYEDFIQGKNIRILELNGVTAEPAHMYDPNFKLKEAYKTVIWHWRRVAEIYIAMEGKPINRLNWSAIRSHYKKQTLQKKS